jgi:uncharacterized protein (DUF2062 family)
MSVTKFDLILGAITLPPVYAVTFALGAALLGYGAPARFLISIVASL